MAFSACFFRSWEAVEPVSALFANPLNARTKRLSPLPKALTELVVRLTGGGKPLNEDLTAKRHSQ
jgi:hypothetical protein